MLKSTDLLEMRRLSLFASLPNLSLKAIASCAEIHVFPPSQDIKNILKPDCVVIVLTGELRLFYTTPAMEHKLFHKTVHSEALFLDRTFTTNRANLSIIPLVESRCLIIPHNMIRSLIEKHSNFRADLYLSLQENAKQSYFQLERHLTTYEDS
ncbi:hypothetical protein GCM10010954_26450 [Halobacillus andaensis]|uniref:Uncharacterized protein n=1 Tax=Halobacillus andaensis TaxID=1176239 RepID=A0A917B911_HALAA|nr:hypothetical protein [Halobacillus andaensis]MBP2005770.1 signal-transduction protein with cAMP-binding, CBS, and nucleotidyltransferase domain [Halobacillus andaensis]GGF26163.1 hypothetical protein GCM10010954_26450 [Halobacillus andaensis]